MIPAVERAPTVPASPSADRRQRWLAALTFVPILATVYQTLVLTDVTGDVIRKGLEADSYQMLWTNLSWGVSTLYGIFLAIWGMARYGQRRTLSVGLVLFSLGNLLCGASFDVPSMAGARLIEGLGKGMTIAIGRSLLYRQFDRAVIGAMGFYGVFCYATRPLTPLCTAYVNDLLSWGWIYWVNVPIALLGLVLVQRFIRPDRPPQPRRLRIDWFAVTLLAGWVTCLLFVFGWYRRWGGWSSDIFSALVGLSALLPLVLLVWVTSGLSPDEHLRRIVRVRIYVLAMCVRMLLLVNFAAVLGIMGTYLTELRDYPREVAGWVIAPASLTMAATTLLMFIIHRREWRHPSLVVAVIGCAACVWWLSSVDNFTSKEQIATILACWGLFQGLFPPVFLTDEVEGLNPRDALYGGALACVFLIIPLLTVPIMTSTTIRAWTDHAADSQRLNIRDDRVAYHQAQARIVDQYRQLGVTGPELSTLTGDTLGGFVKLESLARGCQYGLKFLSLITLGMGLTVAILLIRSPIASDGPGS